MTRDGLARRVRRRLSRDALLGSIRDASIRTGVPVWLVGGYLRDAALGHRAEDLDLAAGRGARRLVRALEDRWGRRGFRFRKRGVTTWRFTVGGRDVDLVDASTRGIEADLMRRELTVNAVAFDLTGGGIVDSSGGLRDLEAGRLRPPRPGVFREDPIRALRAARFLAQLPSFRLHRLAREEAREVAPRLKRASAERVRDELNRLLVAAAPARGLEAMESLGLLEPTLPELTPLRGCVAGRGRPDVWRHTIDAVHRATRTARLPGAAALGDPGRRLVLAWALLLHDVSKPETLGSGPDGRPTFHMHETLGARTADTLLRRLKQSSRLRRDVARLVALHLRPHHLADAGAPARGLRRLVRDAGELLPVLLVHAACDAKASGATEEARRWPRLRAVLRDLERSWSASLERAAVPLVGGLDVMRVLRIPAGPDVGRALERIHELQVEGRLRDRREALRALRRVGRELGIRGLPRPASTRPSE